MLAYFQTLLNVALRKKGPEDIPDSGFLLGLTFVVYLLLQIPLGWITYGPSSVLIAAVGSSALMLILGLWVLLVITGYRARFRQSLTALLGTDAILSAFSIPFSYWQVTGLMNKSSVALPSTVLVVILLWLLSVQGHIISRAISKPFGIGLMIAVAFFFLHTAVLFEITPDTTAP